MVGDDGATGCSGDASSRSSSCIESLFLVEVEFSFRSFLPGQIKNINQSEDLEPLSC